jgi:hypothetical protein
LWHLIRIFFHHLYTHLLLLILSFVVTLHEKHFDRWDWIKFSFHLQPHSLW